jgi:hypothetical protein
MTDKRTMTIHFHDGTKVSFAFPVQTDRQGMTSAIEGLPKREHLTIEADGTLLLFPLSSIKYVQVSPSPEVLPEDVIRRATVVS